MFYLFNNLELLFFTQLECYLNSRDAYVIVVGFIFQSITESGNCEPTYANADTNPSCCVHFGQCPSTSLALLNRICQRSNKVIVCDATQFGIGYFSDHDPNQVISSPISSAVSSHGSETYSATLNSNSLLVITQCLKSFFSGLKFWFIPSLCNPLGWFWFYCTSTVSASDCATSFGLSTIRAVSGLSTTHAESSIFIHYK
ncbi:hypothetical protein ACTA71_007005 [Dictyostelium dimigraforme]